MSRNRDRLQKADNLPYFVRDNAKYFEGINFKESVQEQIDPIGFLTKEAIVKTNQAKKQGEQMQQIAEDIAKKYGARVTPLNTKKVSSIVDKVIRNRKEKLISTIGIESVKDIKRNTIIAERSQIDSIVAELKSREDIINYKRQEGARFIGYSGHLFNIKIDGVILEMQVNTPKMIYAKESPQIAKSVIGVKEWKRIKKEVDLEGGLGHSIYEIYRKLDPNSTYAKKLAKESIEYYSNFLD